MAYTNHIKLVEIPQSGARLYTISGAAHTLAKVFLAPGSGLSKDQRRLVGAHPLALCTVRGDPGTGVSAPRPGDFHRVTLRWLIDRADHIAIWSAPHPQLVDEYASWSIRTVDGGARFVTTIETTPDRATEWHDLIWRWKRRAAVVRFFGPGDENQERADTYRATLNLLD